MLCLVLELLIYAACTLYIHVLSRRELLISTFVTWSLSGRWRCCIAGLSGAEAAVQPVGLCEVRSSLRAPVLHLTR